ncbi:RDD family protein [Nocardia sp. N2S4-5]|uniref:RDD family protein n=1 Tax=Nocardia sp. N2S4-5 TaxID=3351565 RepID=UPI0037D0DB72
MTSEVGLRYTSWPVRVLSAVVDLLLVGVLVAVGVVVMRIVHPWLTPEIMGRPGGTLGYAASIERSRTVTRWLVAAMLLIVGLLSLVNTVVVQGLTGRSLGKFVTKQRLVDPRTARPIGVGRAFLRQFAHTVDALPCYLGFFWPLVDEQRRTFADMLTKTVVVSGRGAEGVGSTLRAGGVGSTMRQVAVGPGLREVGSAPTVREEAVGPISQEMGVGPTLRETAGEPDVREAAVGPTSRGLVVWPTLPEVAVGPISREVGSGPTLREVIATRGPLPESAVRELALRSAEVLAVLHGRGLVHGGVSADAVRLTDRGPVLTGESSSVAVRPPEAILGQHVGPAADVFALGATLVYAVTGIPAFGTGADEVVARRVVDAEPDLTWVPAGLRDVLAGCLTKRPEGRPTAVDLVGLFGGAAAEGSRSASPASEIAGQHVLRGPVEGPRPAVLEPKTAGTFVGGSHPAATKSEFAGQFRSETSAGRASSAVPVPDFAGQFAAGTTAGTEMPWGAKSADASSGRRALRVVLPWLVTALCVVASVVVTVVVTVPSWGTGGGYTADSIGNACELLDLGMPDAPALPPAHAESRASQPYSSHHCRVRSSGTVLAVLGRVMNDGHSPQAMYDKARADAARSAGGFLDATSVGWPGVGEQSYFHVLDAQQCTVGILDENLFLEVWVLQLPAASVQVGPVCQHQATTAWEHLR